MRHTRTVARGAYKPKPVFNSWTLDTPESLSRAIAYDTSLMKVQSVAEDDPKELNGLLRVLNYNYAEIKEIYHYLQGYSSQFPNVDSFTMREKFIKKLKCLRENRHISQFDIIMRAVNQHSREHE